MTEPSTDSSGPKPQPPPSRPKSRPYSASRRSGSPQDRPIANPLEFAEIAMQAVCNNFNGSRDETKVAALTLDDVFIISYSRIMQNWEVFITSPVAKHLFWQVTYNKYKNELYMNVYQRISNSIRIPLPDRIPS